MSKAGHMVHRQGHTTNPGYAGDAGGPLPHRVQFAAGARPRHTQCGAWRLPSLMPGANPTQCKPAVIYPNACGTALAACASAACCIAALSIDSVC